MTEPTKDEIYEKARRLGVEGRSTMSKSELEESVGAATQSQEPPPIHPSGNWIRDHLLSLILGALFLLTLLGQYYFQYLHEVKDAARHGEPAAGALSGDFLQSFLASALENWQSEFLQLASFVVLATYFIHRGSPQSRDGDDEMAADIKAIKNKIGA